jgi:pimeloyl-ACP methyl ester carboxylesterase
MVHGGFATSAAWRRVVVQLAADSFCTYAIDLPGWGASEGPPTDVASLLDQEVAAVEAVIRRATAEPVRLVGHSYGGFVALAVALAARVPIGSLTLFEALPLALLAETGDHDALNEMVSFVAHYRQAYADGEAWAARRVIDLWGGPGSFEALSTATRETMAAGTARNIISWESNLAYKPGVDAYRALRIPTTLIKGEHTLPVSALVSNRLHAIIPGSTLVEIRGAGHSMIYSHAVESADAIRLAVAEPGLHAAG